MVQCHIRLFICHETRIVRRRQLDKSIFLLQILGKSFARPTEPNYSLAVGQLLRQLLGQFIRAVGIHSQHHGPGQLLHDIVRRTA